MGEQSAEQAQGNPDRGPRCGECRLGLGVHEPRDPRCSQYARSDGDVDGDA